MKKLLTVCVVLAIIVFFVSPSFAQNVWRVDTQGKITLNGNPFRVKGGSWFGLEGRQEPYDDSATIRAPMELYVGNVFWAENDRTYDSDINEIKQMGFNVVRLPIAPQTFDANDPQGRDPVLKNAQIVRIANARLALETVIKKLNTAGVFVILDIHSCSNYVGWRKGRLDARPPWVDKSWDNYNFKREDCSCAATGNPTGVTKIQIYDQPKWLSNLKTLAGFASTLSVTNIMGIDIFNEPWDYSWAEWRSLIDSAYTAIDAVNPNILIFAQGIGEINGSQDGTPQTVNQTPHGLMGIPSWGENLYEAGANPPVMPKERLVFSPHCYGPSLRVQGIFSDPNQPQCATLQEDAFGDAKCQIVIDPARLEPSWEEHFGYLKNLGYALCVEFGGNFDWPARAEPRMQNRYSYLINRQSDFQWQQALKSYLCKRGIGDSIYRAINPETKDAYGIYTTPYDPISNTAGWGTWSAPDQRKLSMLSMLYTCDEGPIPTPTSTSTSSPTPTPTMTTCNCGKGDANGDSVVNILDALLVAQYSAGIPVSINLALTDINNDGIVNIVDALHIARYSVGFGFPD